MLFTEIEIAQYQYFSRVAADLNSYYSYFSDNNLPISVLDHHSLNMSDYMSQLKTIIVELDRSLPEKKDEIDEVLLIIIKDFANKINDNLINTSLDVNSTLKFITNFVSSVESFLEQTLSWINNYSFPGRDDKITNVVNSDLFHEFIDISKEVNVILKSNYNYDNKLTTLYRDFNSLSDYDKNVLKRFTDGLRQPEEVNKILILEDRISSLVKNFKELSNEFEKQKNSNFDEQKRLFEERANEALITYQNSLNDLKNQYQDVLVPQVSDLNSKLTNNKTELDSLLGDVKLYQDKMTNNAVAEMSAHYFDKSKFERNSYFAITLLSAFIIIFSVISAYIGVNSYYNEYVSTKSCDSSQSRTIKVNGAIKEMSFEECMKDLSVKREATQKYAFNYLIFRLSFSLLLFLAVIYASRIAMRAYNHWRQSENMYLKLNTLSPFIGSLDKSVRNDVHLSLVPDYFGKDAGMVESSKDAVKDLPTNISNIAIKAIEQAGSTIGSKLGSDKETKNSDNESSTEKNKKKSTDDPE